MLETKSTFIHNPGKNMPISVLPGPFFWSHFFVVLSSFLSRCRHFFVTFWSLLVDLVTGRGEMGRIHPYHAAFGF